MLRPFAWLRPARPSQLPKPFRHQRFRRLDGAFMEPSATVRASGTRAVASAAAGEPPYALPPFGNSTCLIPADPSITV
jgi:hypothetical protein